ncbi:CCR4-NOT transcription complex subunit 9-like protein, partial [Tanacetum coccineum]
HIPLYLYPFLNTTSKSRPFEYLRLTSLGVIGALVKVDDTEVISFLLSTEIIPLCLRTMEMGSELSKTLSSVRFRISVRVYRDPRFRLSQVATFIVQKILLDDVGLDYICTTAERFFAVGRVLGNMVAALAEQPSSRLLKHIIRCYLRLSDNPRACDALRSCLPDMLRDATFSSCLREDPTTRRWLQQLVHNVQGPRVGLQGGGEEAKTDDMREENTGLDSSLPFPPGFTPAGPGYPRIIYPRVSGSIWRFSRRAMIKVGKLWFYDGRELRDPTGQKRIGIIEFKQSNTLVNFLSLQERSQIYFDYDIQFVMEDNCNWALWFMVSPREWLVGMGIIWSMGDFNEVDVWRIVSVGVNAQMCMGDENSKFFHGNIIVKVGELWPLKVLSVVGDCRGSTHCRVNREFVFTLAYRVFELPVDTGRGGLFHPFCSKSGLHSMESCDKELLYWFSCNDEKIAWIKWTTTLASKKNGGLGLSADGWNIAYGRRFDCIPLVHGSMLSDYSP